MNDTASKRLDWARGQRADCRLCPRACGVNRLAGEVGRCGAGAEAMMYMDFVHYGEEAELVPSHTIYLTGCNLRCSFCHTAPDRAARPAVPLTADRLRAVIERGGREGAKNLNILGGEPMVNLPALLGVFGELGRLPPLVWNTNLYCTDDALSMVFGLPDVWLVDLKFGNGACAKSIAGAADYWDVVRDRLAGLCAREGERVIVRHLALPGHIDCCTRPALEWLAARLPAVRVSLKLDYVVMPAARADDRLGRFLSEAEASRAKKLAHSLGLRLVPQGRPESAGSGAPQKSADAQMDVEWVISPRGQVFLRHPTRAAMSVAEDVNERSREEEEVS